MYFGSPSKGKNKDGEGAVDRRGDSHPRSPRQPPSEADVAQDEADVRPQKVTFNLKPRGQVALQQIQAVTGEDKTDSINAALRLYAMVLEAGPDVQLYIVAKPGYGYERVHLP
jgi:hypothetical protein